jgi:hypothetical protein
MHPNPLLSARLETARPNGEGQKREESSKMCQPTSARQALAHGEKGKKPSRGNPRCDPSCPSPRQECTGFKLAEPNGGSHTRGPGVPRARKPRDMSLFEPDGWKEVVAAVNAAVRSPGADQVPKLSALNEHFPVSRRPNPSIQRGQDKFAGSPRLCCQGGGSRRSPWPNSQLSRTPHERTRG